VIVYTAYIRAHAAPVLVPERFSWGALLFGPLWLALHGAWIAAILAFAADAAIGELVPDISGAVLSAALALLLGLFGQDLRRWTLERRGFAMAHIVAAPDAESALVRLLQRRPDLIGPALAVEAVR
jgi:hypothetical protein